MLFTGIYTAYGATFGVVGGGAPLVLRAHGLSLDSIGLLQLVYLPIGLAFVWAPLVDRLRIGGLPHRLTWIGAGMGATSLLLALLGRAERWPVAAVFAIALAISMAMATADIALEALVVETVPAARRPFVTTAKLCGSSIGTMIGVGLATAFPRRLGLSGALLLVAGLDAALLLPVFAYPEARLRLATRAGVRARKRDRDRLRLLLRRAGVLGAFFAPAIMIVSVPNLVLLDLRFSLPTVGFFTGTLSTLVGVAMSLGAGAMLTRVAAHRIVAVLACGVAASGLLFALAIWLDAPRLGFSAAVLNVVFEGGLGVPVFNTIYRWAEGEHAGTDYALLFGVAFLVSFPARVLAPMLGGWIGWSPYFLVCVPVYALAVALLVGAMRETA